MEAKLNKLVGELNFGVVNLGKAIAEDVGVIENVEKRLTALEEALITQKNLVEELKKENEARKIAFSTALLSSGEGSTGPFNAVTPLIYKKVFTNAGNGYDPSTGIFTAPVKGVYYLRFYCHGHGGRITAGTLYKNNESVCSVYDTPTNASSGNATNGVILTLAQGDKISMKLRQGCWVFDDAWSYTSFGGFLLFPL